MSESYELEVVWTGAHRGCDADLFRPVDWDQVTVPVSDQPNYYVDDRVKQRARDRMRRRRQSHRRRHPESYAA